MFFIFLLSVGCAIWAVHPNMGYPALYALAIIQAGAIVMTTIVTRNKRRDEELRRLQADLHEARSQIVMLSLDKELEGKIVNIQRPRPLTWPFNS